MTGEAQRSLAHVRRWRELVSRSLKADPSAESLTLGVMAADAKYWVVPSPKRADVYLFSALIAAAKAFGAQSSLKARAPLCEPMSALARIVLDVIDREEAPAEPAAPLRHRADLDD